MINASEAKSLEARERNLVFTLFYPNSTDYQYLQVKKYGLFYDFRFLRYIAAVHRYKHFQVAYDIGTCFANHAVYFGKLLDCHVECFEPNSKLLKYASENLNHARVSYRIHNFALGDEDAEGSIAENTANLGGSRFNVTVKASEQALVKIKALDTLVGDLSLKDPNFLKIDTEGFEFQVLNGARCLIDRAAPEIFIEISRENRTQTFLLLKRLGYKLVYHFGKNYHFSRTLTLPERLLLALTALVIDAKVSLTKNVIVFGRLKKFRDF